MPFEAQKLISEKSNLYFLLLLMLLISYPRNYCFNPRSWRFTFIFCCKSLVVLTLTFKSMIHFFVFLYMVWNRGPNSLLCIWASNGSAPFVKKTIPHWMSLGRVYFWFWLLFPWSMYMTLCQNHIALVIVAVLEVLKSQKCESFKYVLFPRLFWLFWILEFLYIV